MHQIEMCYCVLILYLDELNRKIYLLIIVSSMNGTKIEQTIF